MNFPNLKTVRILSEEEMLHFSSPNCPYAPLPYHSIHHN